MQKGRINVYPLNILVGAKERIIMLTAHRRHRTGSVIFFVFIPYDKLRRQVVHKKLLKLLVVNRLCYVVHKTVPKEHFPCPVNGVCGKGYAGSAFVKVLVVAPHLRNSLQTVLAGHAVVNKDNVVLVLLYKVNGSVSAKGSIQLNLGLLKQVCNNGKVYLHVVHNKNPCIWRMERL